MKIRSYSKKELALLYFPDSHPHTASNHLMRWINRNRELCQALEAEAITAPASISPPFRSTSSSIT